MPCLTLRSLVRHVCTVPASRAVLLPNMADVCHTYT